VQASNYRLECLPSDNMFYVVSPRDIVVARPCDKDDHIAWLLSRRKYVEALADANMHQAELKRHKVIDIGELYLNSLIQAEKYRTLVI